MIKITSEYVDVLTSWPGMACSFPLDGREHGYAIRAIADCLGRRGVDGRPGRVLGLILAGVQVKTCGYGGHEYTFTPRTRSMAGGLAGRADYLAELGRRFDVGYRADRWEFTFPRSFICGGRLRNAGRLVYAESRDIPGAEFLRFKPIDEGDT